MIRYARAIIFLLVAIAIVGILIAIARPSRGPGISEAELARLCARARLVWEDYGEGIKAALGATPAALWHGEPVEARLTESGIDVRFEVGAPWDRFDFGLPILLRDPEGRVISPAKYQRGDHGGVYSFRHETPLTPLAVPWIELRYPPNEEKRIVLDSTGAWKTAPR